MKKEPLPRKILEGQEQHLTARIGEELRGLGLGGLWTSTVTSLPGLFDAYQLWRFGFEWNEPPTVEAFLSRTADKPEYERAQNRVRDALMTHLGRARESAAEEARFLAALSAPEEAILAALFASLLAAHRSVRETVGPVLNGMPRPRVAFEPDPPAFECAHWISDQAYPSVRFGRARAELSDYRDRIVTRCTCGAPCLHQLMLLEGALKGLCQPATSHTSTSSQGGPNPPSFRSSGLSPLASRAAWALPPEGANEWSVESVRQALATPNWQRLLEAFDRSLLVAAPSAKDHVIAWRLFTPGGHETADLAASDLSLSPVLQKPLKRGGYSTGTKLDPTLIETAESWTPSAADVAAANALSAKTGEAAMMAALCCLTGHARLFLGGEALHLQPTPLVFSVLDEEAGLKVVPQVREFRLSPHTLLEAPHDSRHALWIEPPTLALAARRGWLVALSSEARALLVALARYPAPLPKEAAPQLMERVQRLETLAPIELSASLAGEKVDPDSRLVLRLRLLGSGLNVEAFVRPLLGGPAFPPGIGPIRVSTFAASQRHYTERDLALEKTFAAKILRELPLPVSDDSFQFTLQGEEAALDLMRALQALTEPVECEWFDPKERPVLGATVLGRNLRVAIQSKKDWFDLRGDVEIDGDKISLAQLIEAARAGKKYVPIVANGSDPAQATLGPNKVVRWHAIEASLAKRLQELSDVAKPTRHGLEVAPQAAPVVAALTEEGAQVEGAATFADLCARMERAKHLDIELPQRLTATLRPYQFDGYAWLRRLSEWGAGGCLADDMGLGKTVQAIAVLVSRAHLGPQLVVAPTSVCFNWERECARFAPGLRCLRPLHTGGGSTAQALGANDLLIVSYGQVTRAKTASEATEPNALWSKLNFATLVLDEAQAIKNAHTARAQAVRALRADWCFALSGTPIENHLGEIWSLFSVLAPGLLGSWEQFRTRFAAPIERDGSPSRKAALAALLKPFILRRRKAEVTPELPPRTDVTVPVDLSAEERDLYNQARLFALAQLSAEGAAKDQRFATLAALTRLRLCACHPRLYDPTSTLQSSKLKVFLAMASELRENGHRALVFSQFTSHLGLVQEALAESNFNTLYLDGSTPSAQRARLVDEFQSGSHDLFLISLKAGGTGINLDAADYVFHLDPWWNPAVEEQASARAHRIGQNKPVTVYRLVASATVEEQIMALHQDKRDLAESLLSGKTTGEMLDHAQLLQLLSA